MYNKPAFPTTSTFGSFGANQSTPFGQTSTTFGSTLQNKPAFGSNVFGSTPTPLFGTQTQTPGTSLFSTPSSQPFGQSTQTTQNAFGGFGSTGIAGTTGTGTGLFGASTSTQSNTGLFGAQNATSPFAQNKPLGFSSFGSTNTGANLFGQTSNTAQQNTTPQLFGQPAQTGGMFGTLGTSGFSSSSNGTALVKFNPVSGSDTMVKNQITHRINTRIHCITCMKEYETKSLEELRYEDYMMGRKGPSGGAQPAQTGIFGATGGLNQPPTSNLFGSSATGSVFGTSSNVFGAQPNATNSLFNKPATGGFGTTATQPATPFSFGATTSTASPFGATNQNKQFGAIAPFSSTSTTPSFGTFGQTANQSTFGSSFGAQPTQTGLGQGLFGQNKPATNLFSNTLTSTSNTAPGFGTGLFGQTQTNTGSNLFGGNKTAPFGGGGGLFGQQSQQQATQPTFSFGQTSTNTFGTQNTSGGLMFNQPANNAFAKPLTGFGNTLGNSSLPGTGQQNQLTFGNNTFGTNTQQTGLFGNKPATGGLFGSSGGLMTSGTNPGGSLFGQGGGSLGSGFGTNTFQNTGQSGLFGQSNILGTNTGNTFSLNQSKPDVHEQILSLSTRYPTSDFFKNLPDELSSNTMKKSIITNSLAQKKIIEEELNYFKPKTTNRSVINRRLLTGKENQSLFSGLDDDFNIEENIKLLKSNPKRLILNKFSNSKKDATSATSINGGEQQQYIMNDINSLDVTDFNEQKLSSKLNQRSTNDFQNSSTKSVNSFDNNGNTNENGNDKTNGGDSIRDSVSSINNSSNDSSVEEYPAGVVCSRPGYYTIPSREKLAQMVNAETGRLIVSKLTIGRRNYGNVYFPDEIDITGMNIDEIVFFCDRELTVYPDDKNKPPVGQGLNRRAQVTLDRVWPKDRETREVIRDTDRLFEIGYEDVLRRCCQKHGQTFKDYRPETGSWVFWVEHF